MNGGKTTTESGRSTRRAMLAGCAAAAGVAATLGVPKPARAASATAPESPFLIGLNTATVRGHKLGIVETIDLAAKAGYRGMEPWLDEIRRYAEQGGSLPDLKKRFEDVGISIESAIDFFEWAVDDPERRRKGLENAKKTFDLLQKIGAKRVAAPPSGANNERMVDISPLPERYRAVLELGDQFGVIPEVEFWGHSKTLSTLAEASYVAIGSGHPKACIVADVYHMHRGGSPFEGLKLLSPSSLHCIHFNDYPDAPERQKLTDADRVYPGDGVAPIKSILRTLADGGFKVMLSLEVFNKGYYKQDPFTVMKTGHDKMKALVEAVVAS